MASQGGGSLEERSERCPLQNPPNPLYQRRDGGGFMSRLDIHQTNSNIMNWQAKPGSWYENICVRGNLMAWYKNTILARIFDV